MKQYLVASFFNGPSGGSYFERIINALNEDDAKLIYLKFINQDVEIDNFDRVSISDILFSREIFVIDGNKYIKV